MIASPLPALRSGPDNHIVIHKQAALARCRSGKSGRHAGHKWHTRAVHDIWILGRLARARARAVYGIFDTSKGASHVRARRARPAGTHARTRTPTLRWSECGETNARTYTRHARMRCTAASAPCVPPDKTHGAAALSLCWHLRRSRTEALLIRPRLQPVRPGSHCESQPDHGGSELAPRRGSTARHSKPCPPVGTVIASRE